MIKNLLLSFIGLMILTVQVNAQVTLEKTYSGVSAGLANTETYGDKYYIMDVPNSQCRIYNIDHSLWKTINLSVPSGYYLYDIQYVTDHLFNTDNSIELLYVIYNYNSTGEYYTYETRIVTETGTQILAVPGAGYNAITAVSGAGTKLFTYIYDNSVTPYTITTKVYNLAGSLPTTAVAAIESPQMKAYPNPAKENLTIKYTLPTGVQQAELTVLNNSGQVVGRYVVDNQFGDLQLNTAMYPSGIYFWRLTADGKTGSSQKIIISH